MTNLASRLPYFANSLEINRSYDGFPVDFRILVSADGRTWDEIARRAQYRVIATNPDGSEQKPRDTTGAGELSPDPGSRALRQG